MAPARKYTSAERGLRPGTRGFCTVAYTRGMAPETVRLLEALSAYTPLFPAHDPRAKDNPIAVSHARLTLRGQSLTILSRLAPERADHTHRSNKIAHHVLLGRREQPAGGPAWLATQPGFFLEHWADEPHRIEQTKRVPEGDPDTTRAETWNTLCGDAGWAGILAHACLSRPQTPAFLVFEPGMDPLPLLAEATALLPPEQRWQVTFNTYFTAPAAGAVCLWRCCPPNAECLREARRNPRTLVLDLTQPLGEPDDLPLVRSAREGRKPQRTHPNAPTQEHDPSEFITMPNRTKKRLRMRPRGF